MRRGGMTPGFVSSNRGKRSILLDLKRPEALSVLHRLIAVSDVLSAEFSARCSRPARLRRTCNAGHQSRADLCFYQRSGRDGTLRPQARL